MQKVCITNAYCKYTCHGVCTTILGAGRRTQGGCITNAYCKHTHATVCIPQTLELDTGLSQQIMGSSFNIGCRHGPHERARLLQEDHCFCVCFKWTNNFKRTINFKRTNNLIKDQQLQEDLPLLRVCFRVCFKRTNN